MQRLTWYKGWLSLAWASMVVALITTASSRVWAGNNCQPAPQPASEKVAEVGLVIATIVAFGAGFALLDSWGKAPFAKRVSAFLLTVAACVALLLIELRHAPSCRAV